SDQGTVDLVSVVAQRPERAQAMLLGTYRPAQAAALDHPLQQVLPTLRVRRRCVEIALEYLTRDDVAAYLERRFGGARVDGEVAAVVYAHTDGNPLFMTVLVDHLLARNWLAEGAAGWRLKASRATIEQDLPDDLRRLIEGQLRFVSPEERDVLEAASVAGTVFDAPAVAAGLGVPADRVESICRDLCGAQPWLRHLENGEWPDGALAARYAFRHALYQLALYDRLPPSRRAMLHEQIGRRLEEGYAGRTAEVSSELARHFQGSRDPRRALTYLEQAATRAYERRGYRDVIACVEPALRLLAELPATPESARDELRLRRLHAVVLSQTAGYTAGAVLENLERIRILSGRLGDLAAHFDALSALYLLNANAGDLRRMDALDGPLLELAERLDASAVVQACYVRGAASLWRASLGTAESLLARAQASLTSLEDADRPYGVNPAVGTRSFESLRRWLAGDVAGARAVQRQALALAERNGRPFTLAHAGVFGAFLSILEEDWTESRRLGALALELAEEYGFPLWHGLALVVHGRALVELGEEAAGLVQIKEGLELRRSRRLVLGNSLLLSFFAGACLRADRVEEGLAAANAGLTHCRESDERCFEAELWRLKSALITRRAPLRGQARQAVLSEAEQCLDGARAVARAQGAQVFEQRLLRADIGGVAARRFAR
ncbi:MAG TPA: hypothetical protein VEL75_02605, partial [Candidatus Methylomirabilis sp.]|nr:hypothetical protein [Candidatus Methylomirabilis sp.]